MDTKLKEWLETSSTAVFFGGAGVSTESGIPDFRSTDGLYHQSYAYPPETILSHSFFLQKPKEFFGFYFEKMLVNGVRPNRAHLALAELEKTGKVKAVVTQNIDGLHQAAGSSIVLELHGSIHRNRCMSCGRFFSGEGLRGQRDNDGVPRCGCGGMIKPDVVLYEENLDTEIVERSVEYISHADMLIIGGTSLAVYPAAGLIRYYHGNKLVLINKSPTPADSSANLLLQGAIGDILEL